GVAPGAGLIDVRVIDSASNSCAVTATWGRMVDALQKIYDNRNKWNVQVVNMSLQNCNAAGFVPSGGLDAFSQLVDLAESVGIVVVAAASNNGPSNNGLPTPAAATRAITVAASQTLNTVNRADDNMAGFSSRGPRDSDNDSDQIDELKPEVTAPGADLPSDDVFDNDAFDADASAWTRTTAQVASGTNVTINVTSSADIAAGELIDLHNRWTGATREIVQVTTSAGAGGTSFTATTTMTHPSNTGVWEQRGILAARHNTTNQAARMAGTSMAAPHVAGLAALIMQARPGINIASVKDLVISTAELPTGTPASLPAVDPTWNDRWGWGLVSASEALDVTQDTDLMFPSHPPSPIWLSPDITTTKLTIGKPATVTAKIRNKGPTAATGVRVHFGVHVFSASTTTFYDLGTKIVNIPVNPSGSTDVPIKWTPKNVGHQCFKVEIGYGPDTDYSNNKAQRNIVVSHKTAALFKVKNTLIEELSRIHFVTDLENPGTGWDYRIEPPEVYLSADDPAVEIAVELIPPPDAGPDAQQMLHVAAVIDTESGPHTLGGVSVQVVASCENDFDRDGDVDGLDLAAFATNPEGGDLAAFAVDFGQADCPSSE
ncbi:MAG: S8 family serine peptidase, partial [bacterium]|nr:S8 family serine peptidase [bacterium]